MVWAAVEEFNGDIGVGNNCSTQGITKGGGGQVILWWCCEGVMNWGTSIGELFREDLVTLLFLFFLYFLEFKQKYKRVLVNALLFRKSLKQNRSFSYF